MGGSQLVWGDVEPIWDPGSSKSSTLWTEMVFHSHSSWQEGKRARKRLAFFKWNLSEAICIISASTLWPELCLMLISSCKEGCWKASILGGLLPSKGSASSKCILGATGNFCRDYMVLKFPEKCTQWMSGILKEKEENCQISAAPYI